GKLAAWSEKYPAVKLVNMYGITETTVHVTYKEIREKEIDSGINNIGQPIPTLSVYVLDPGLNLQPIGVPGQCCVGGEGVGRGYLNRVQLTAEKFVDNPYKPGQRLYLSGDLVKRLSNGEMEYLGRIDHQVKIRGFRVELGEIEKQLLHLTRSRLKDTVVVVKEDKNGDNYLCAFIVTGGEVEVSAVREELSTHLPDFMVPSYFVELEKIPLTPNGKVDRKALPEPGLVAGESYRAPRDDTETQMVALWADVLGRDDTHASQLRASIGIDDNFFRLGGHSLKAVLLISRIHQAFNVKIPLAEIFQAPTIAGISRYVREAVKEVHIPPEPVEEKEYYPLSSAQRRLYILHRMDEAGTGYNIPAMFMLEGMPDQNRLENAFHGLIKRHESFRTSFHMIDNQPVQRVHDHVELEIEFFGRGVPLWSPLHGNHSDVDGNGPGIDRNNPGANGNNPGTHGGV
ncbi:MAG: AMP-binding protein, partial [bacterium]|nr:AMP-binding protein [bacterium]